MVLVSFHILHILLSLAAAGRSPHVTRSLSEPQKRNRHNSTEVQWRRMSPTFVVNGKLDITPLRRRVEFFTFLVAHLADHLLHLGDFTPAAYDIP